MKLHIAKNYSIDAREYANTGNAILGIKGAGKSYTAMKIAEELLDAGIPIIVFDPIGIWRHLKVGVDGHKGYPVVVAGGNDPDIKLTVNNVQDLVRAAMKENISLVLDLYCVELATKATWIRIVQEAVHLLMYENLSHGLRHIFLEEAAEFIPQRLQPQHAKVYSEIERLARMGRNSKLGYTLINQRAEEVNKSILEISERSFLHKQVGKNSLKSIKEWFGYMGIDPDTINNILKSLPKLEKGECWMIEDGHGQTMHISKKKTFHPSPEKETPLNEPAAKKADVSKFIANMQKALEPKEKPITTTQIKKDIDKAKNYSKAFDRIDKLPVLEAENKDLKQKLIQAQKIIAGNAKDMASIASSLKKSMDIISHQCSRILMNIDHAGTEINKIEFKPITLKMTPSGPGGRILVAKPVSNGKESGGMNRMLKAAAMFPGGISKSRMALIAGMSPNSGSFRTYISSLRQSGLITGSGDNIGITQEGLNQAGNVSMPDPDDVIESWCQILGTNSGPAKMLRALADDRQTSVHAGLTKLDLATAVGMSETSGSFRTYISTLNRNGLIEKKGNEIHLAAELNG